MNTLCNIPEIFEFLYFKKMYSCREHYVVNYEVYYHEDFYYEDSYQILPEFSSRRF